MEQKQINMLLNMLKKMIIKDRNMSRYYADYLEKRRNKELKLLLMLAEYPVPSEKVLYTMTDEELNSIFDKIGVKE